MSSSAASSAGPHVTSPPTDYSFSSAFSTTYIRYSNGEPQLCVTDVASTGFGGALHHTRKYSNQLLQGAQTVSKDYGNGYNWLISNLPHLIDGSDGESYVAAIFDSAKALWFNSDSPYAPRYGAKYDLDYTYDGDILEDIYTLTDPDGRKQQFYKLDSNNHPAGALIRAFLPGGQTIEATYDGTLLIKLELTDGLDTESLLYVYDELNGADVIVSVTLVRNSTNLRRVVYEYYESLVEHKGSIGDLKSATQQDYVNGEWVTHDVYFYQYYTDSEGDGFQHGLRYVLGPEGYRRMVEAGKDPETANDVEDYADNYFEYDANQRADKAEVAGGTQIYLFGYTTNPSGNYTDGYNNWKKKTVEDRPDGSKLTVYTNYLGQPLLKELIDAEEVDNWVEYFVYNDDGRLIEHWTPAAVTDYDDDGGNGSELVVTADEDGLIHVTDYYGENPSPAASASTAGGVEGYVQFQKVKEGDSGTAIKISETKYKLHNDGSTDIYYVAEQIVYQDEASGGSNPVTTEFSNTWYDDSHQIKQRTTTPETVTTAKNGSDSSNYRYEYFDEYGNLTWSKDERGRVTYHQYDIAAGARTRTIQDVDGYQSAELDPPTGYAGQSGGLHLVSDFQGDDQGRVTRSLGPAHNSPLPLDEGEWESASVRTAVWTVYDNEHHQVRTARGYAVESQPGSGQWDVLKLENPVSIVKQDNGGRTLESISATWDATIQEFLAADHDDFPQSTFVRWTTNQYDATGRLTSTRVYHNLPDSGVGFSGTHYAQTAVDYDATGRQNMQTTPGGTITRTTFDCRGNQIGDYVGTDDTGATDADPTNGDANGMKLVTEYDYEGAGGSCACSGGLEGGLLSILTQHVDGEQDHDRVTEYDYDWRNRRETTTSNDGATTFILKNTHDNLGRATQVDRYHTSVVAGNLVGRDKTYYDELSRAYKTERYAVDPSDGTVGNALTDNIWYDAAGNVVKQKPAGSDSFTKTVHDGLNRPIKTFVGLDTDETSYADAATVDGDTIFEQAETTYNPANQVTWTVTHSRMHDATGTGELSSPDGFEPRARAAYSGVWYDPLGRRIAAANFGTVAPAEGRPEEPPPLGATAGSSSSADDVLVSTVEYDSTGQAYRTVDAKGRDDRREFDAAGRVVRTISNYCSGSNADDKNVTVETTYTVEGMVSTLTAKNSTTGDQVTQYAYGTALADSEIADTRLLRGTVYPDSQNTFTMSGGAPTFSDTGGYNRVEFTYNRQGEQVTKKDQNETAHTFAYDLLGRQTADAATTVGGDIDESVRRIEREYEVRGMVQKVTSYDAAAGGYAVNEVALSYDDFGALSVDRQEHLGVGGDSSLKVQYARANGADNHTRLNTVTYPNGRVVHHEYSSGNDSDLSRVSYLSETNSGGTQYAAYTYLGAGQIVKVDYPQPDLRYNLAHGAGDDPYDGMDRFGRTIDLLWYDYGSSADAVRIKHGYDRAGNRTYREDIVSKSQETPVYLDERYIYDGMYQLTALQRGQLNSTKDGLETDSKNFAEQWTLDPLGNFANFKQDTDGDGDWDLDQDRAHNKANEIVTIAGDSDEIAHDAAGNMIRAPKPDNWNDHYHFVYDAWNRLVEVQTSDEQYPLAIFEYDGLNRRIVKWTYDESHYMTDCRHYYYSDKWQVLEERVDPYTGEGPYSGSGIPSYIGYSGSAYYSGSGISGSGVPQYFRVDRQYVWGLRYVDDLVLRDRDADSDSGTGLEERLYALQDPNWNVVAIADTSGDVQERFRYDAFGKPKFLSDVFGSASDTSSYSWNDLYTGRRYDVNTGLYDYRNRVYHPFLGRFITRDPKTFTSQDVNLYRYVGNEVLGSVDPTGFDRWFVTNGFHYWIVVEECKDGKRTGKYIALDFSMFGFTTRYQDKPGTTPGSGIIGNAYGQEMANHSSCEEDEALIHKWESLGECNGPQWMSTFFMGLNCFTMSLVWYPYPSIGGPLHPCEKPFRPFVAPCKCFVEGTPVLCPDGARPIESIKEGDYVLAYDLDNKRIVESKVVKCEIFPGDFDILEVKVSDGNYLQVTTEHAFYNGVNWIPSNDLATGGPILDASGRRVPVSATGPTRRNGTTTYNLRTEHKTYLVGRTGLVVSDRDVWTSRMPNNSQVADAIT